MDGKPRTQYARNGDNHIAYQVVGDGDRDLLLVDTWAHHVEAVWDFPELARFLRRLASFGRLIHFDHRGTGLSDPVPIDQLPDLHTQVDDAVAVLRAVGSPPYGAPGPWWMRCPRSGFRSGPACTPGKWVRGTDLGGLAVHIAARIAALAGDGEVLVSSTVKDLLASSDIVFDDRSEHELKGVPGTWRLFAAMSR